MYAGLRTASKGGLSFDQNQTRASTKAPSGHHRWGPIGVISSKAGEGIRKKMYMKIIKNMYIIENTS